MTTTTTQLKRPYAIRLITGSFVHPDAINSNYSLAISKPERAAAFATVDEAKKFWEQVRRKFESATTATVVQMEQVNTSRFDEYNALLRGSDVEKVTFVLARGVHEASRYRTATDYYSRTLEGAARYSTIHDALVALANISTQGMRNEATYLIGVREVTEVTFSVTDVEQIVSERFVTFNIDNSSVIKSLAYDSTRKILRITLTRGAKQFGVNGERMQPNAVYQYADVSAEDVFAFLAADSKGSYWSKTFKGKYDLSASKV